MIPCMTRQDTSLLVSQEPKERLAFWQGYFARGIDGHDHACHELNSMAKHELHHARQAVELQKSSMPSSGVFRVALVGEEK